MNTQSTTLPSTLHVKSLELIGDDVPAADHPACNETLRVDDRLRLDVRGVRRASFTEFFVTGTVLMPMSPVEAASSLFELVASALSQRGIQTIQEKLFGLAEIRPQVLQQRELQYELQGLDADVPVTWVMGTPLRGCDFVGVQVWGLLPHTDSVSVRTIRNPVSGAGRLVQGPGYRMVHLPQIMGIDEARSNLGDGRSQANEMLRKARQALVYHDFGYEDVVRTWIYFARLLDWYDDLNQVRTRHYREIGFGVPGGPAFPASTGIQGRHSDEECMMDVLALIQDGNGCPVATPVIYSPRQDQSFNYGSAFSRGMIFNIEGRRTISISGTASINSAGVTVHLGNAELQCFETLMCVSAILGQQGGDLRNISAATLYCKDRGVWEAWERICKLLGIPDFPTVCVIADVCRDNLLVEMEAFAIC